MDDAGEEGGQLTYALTERFFGLLGGPSAQEYIDDIVPKLISLLPPPVVPAPKVESDSDSDFESDSDDRVPLTSSDSEASDAGEGHAALAEAPPGDGEDLIPPPVVPAPKVESDSDSESDSEDRFPLTSSDSEAADAGEGHAVLAEAPPGDGEDLISRLPDVLLTDIIHRLPTKDAVRTTALSTHWRRVWAATPLLIDDAHLSDGGSPKDVSIVRAVSRCGAAHPGPIGGVRITRVSFFAHEHDLRCLIAALADKDVKDLILFNRPWPLDMPLPGDILRCASLGRLYLGAWHLPKMTAACPPAFPELRELGLFHCTSRNKDLDAMLAHCPKLEVLSFAMSDTDGDPSHLRLASHSLQVVVDWLSMFEGVVVQDAPCLKRLIFDTSVSDRRPIRILRAPKLEVLGFLDLSVCDLEIGGTVIRAGVNVNARAMVPSLKILAVKIQFACNSEAKLLPTLLKCFPHLETLHIMSVPSDSPDSVPVLSFWQTEVACECLKSHLKTLVLHGSSLQIHEAAFLKYILREGKALKTVGVVCSDEKPRNFRGGTNRRVSFHTVTSLWSFQTAIDSSLDDPFYLAPAEA